jgi:hypothetical protein
MIVSNGRERHPRPEGLGPDESQPGPSNATPAGATVEPPRPPVSETDLDERIERIERLGFADITTRHIHHKVEETALLKIR